MLVCSAADASSATEALSSEVRSNLHLWAGESLRLSSVIIVWSGVGMRRFILGVWYAILKFICIKGKKKLLLFFFFFSFKQLYFNLYCFLSSSSSLRFEMTQFYFTVVML